MYLADTGILLRFLLRNDPSYPAIRQAVRIIKTRREQLVTTAQNIAEFWNVCTRPTAARGGLGLSVEATERRLRLLERHFRVLPEPSPRVMSLEDGQRLIGVGRGSQSPIGTRAI